MSADLYAPKCQPQTVQQCVRHVAKSDGNCGKRDGTGTLTADHDFSYDIRLEWNGRYYFGAIVALDASGLLHTSCSVMSSDRFEKVWLQLNEINQRYSLTGYVSGPAGNLKEGNEVARQILGEGQHEKPTLQEERK
ncbi:MAG: hypothetical protein K0Q94_3925 [Paenibacillus sp.]|jgi:hypothetical protein|nr:hypothetical protein [Paenibacillus sp.]